MTMFRFMLTLFFCLTLNYLVCVEAKKKSDNTKFLEEIETIKAFKKLLRTKTNILVLFAENESAATKKFDIFGEAASISKGTGTLAWVDCSTKEGKKLCKKQKASPKPVDIQHYKDGEFSSAYDRRFTVKSIVAFLKNPKSDGPWSEEESAKDVVQIESEKQLNKLINKNKPMLVMFYAPWCGHCKRFKPVFAEVATELKGKVIMAGVDAEGMKDATSIRETYNVTGFPKSIYFDQGKQKFEYGAGHKKEDLEGWLNDPQPPKEKEPEVEWSDMENDVDHLTGDNFDSFIAENEKVLVFFYAPWCGHCKNLKPEWDKAATQIKEQEISGKLAALDATKYREFGDRYKVTGYPTIIYFENGEKKYDASGAFKRDAEGIVAYIQNPSEPPPPEKDWSEVESNVLHLDDESFKAAVRKKKHSLVMFYAPWCGHCKAAKPEYVNAASQFADNNKVVLAAVDCTKSKEVCSTYEVKGYPTFYYLNYGKNEEKYGGGRVAKDFVKFVELNENKTLAANYTTKFWTNIKHAELLHHLTDKSWYEFVHSNPKVLLTVYSEDCPNCQQVRKELADCAKALIDQEIPVKVAVIDSEIYGEEIYRVWTVDMGVPTIFWYYNGIKQFEYTKSRASQDLLEFAKNPVKPKTPTTHPDWSMQESADDIYHLSDQGFDQFAKEQEYMMVVFYSPTCSACLQIRRPFEEAASRLDDEKPEATLVAVNIAQNQNLKAKFDINSYPFFAYFRDGKYKFKYTGSPSADAIVEFMKKPTEPKKEDLILQQPETNITSLNDDNFNIFIKKHQKVLVMFQTSWCGHCRQFKPKFQKAADILVTKNPKSKLVIVDGSVNKNLLKKYEVHGYPTMLYFENGKFANKYPGKRTTDSVVEFMTSAPSKTELGDEILKSKPRAVTSLNSTNLRSFLEEKSQAFVMFYSPGCGACKTAKRPFFQTAVEVDDEDYDISIGIIDAFKHRNIMDEFKLTGYPTFWYFKDGEKKFKYQGPRDKKSFLKFIDNPVEDKNKPETTVQWISETSQVEHLNIDTFDKYLAKYRDVLVFFYINACEICLNQMKPEYVQAADMLYNVSASAKLTAINAGWEKEISKKYSINSFPTVLYFRKGEFQYKYEGAFTKAAIVTFMKDPRRSLAKKPRPTAWQDMSSKEYGHVTHLGNTTFTDFLTSHDHSVIMFHSLFYARCKPPRQQFRVASDILSSLSHVGVGAVDCHRSPEQGLVCYHLAVKQFPSYHYYKGSALKEEPKFDNAKEIVEFLQKKITTINKEEL